MRKLFNLREWLTVQDAARHLSMVTTEELTESDVLRLALDGHLKLSVNFVNYALAECGEVIEGKVIDCNVAEWKELPNELIDFSLNIPDVASGVPISRMMSLDISDTRFVNLTGQLAVIKGIWDLPMIGSERISVENTYHLLVNHLPVTRMSLRGALVESRSGRTICQLQEKPDVSGNFSPRQYLPEDSVLVVRTDSLRELEKSINGTTEKRSTPHSTTWQMQSVTNTANQDQHATNSWGNHNTHLLSQLSSASIKFWSLYDSSDSTTAPTNEQVENWLIEQSVPKRIAEVMATILRADGLKKGRRK